jgi:hypothetical protein
MAPVFTAVADKQVFNVAAGGYLPMRSFADATFRPLAGSGLLADKEMLDQGILPLEAIADLIANGPEKAGALKPMYTFEPGQTRHGAAIWSNLDNRFRELKIVIHGLTNSHRYEENLRRALVLTFERNSDGLNVDRTELKYVTKKWEYIWMWDQDISIPIPSDPKDPQIKAQKLATPAGGERFVWSFPFDVKNSTKSQQELAIMGVSCALPIEVDVAGTKIPLEVRVVDAGQSTIYKAQLLRSLNVEVVKDRFQNKTLVDGAKTLVERHRITLDAGKSMDRNLAVFDAEDVDWDNAVEQIENVLSLNLDKSSAAKQYWDEYKKSHPNASAENQAGLYNPHRALNDDELKSVKEQILKAIPDAVEKAKAKKSVTAYFNCVSSMSSGDLRITRSYRQPGVVEDSWLKAWEELDK